MKKTIGIEIDSEAPDNDTSSPWDEVVSIVTVDDGLKIEVSIKCEMVLLKELMDEPGGIDPAVLAELIIERAALDMGLDLYPKLRTKIALALADRSAVSG